MSAIDNKFQSKNFKSWNNSDLRNIPVDGKRYNSYDFMEKEWEFMWPRVWLLLGREEEIPFLRGRKRNLNKFSKEAYKEVILGSRCPLRRRTASNDVR